MNKEIFKYNEANILCPNKRIYQFYLYSRFLLNFKKIYLNEKVNENCDLYLIDQEYVQKINTIKGPNKKFIIFFWNGQFDYDIYFKKRFYFKDKNILNLIIGSSNEKSNLVLEELFKNNETQIIGIGLKNYIDINFTFIKVLLRFLIYPLYTIQNLCINKLIFVGFGHVEKNSFINIQNTINSNLFKYLNEYSLFDNIAKREKYLEDLITNEKLNELNPTEKCYLIQVIFRDIIIKKLVKFKNFKYFSNDKNLSVQRSFLFRLNHFLDLGPKEGGLKFYERTLTYIMYKKKFISIDFLPKIEADKDFFNKKLFRVKNFLTKIDRIDKDLIGKKLALEIKNLFEEINKKNT